MPETLMGGSMRLVSTLVAASVLMASSAGAADLSIRAFYGTFSGGAVAENADSVYFATTARDSDVVIKPDGEGFSLTWSSVIRRGGVPGAPDVRRKSTTKRFVPAKRRGLWWAAGSADPIDGGELGWARIQGNALIVYLMVIDDNGAYQLQRYERALSGLGMALTFTRLRDGEEVRTAKGRLVKTAK